MLLELANVEGFGGRKRGGYGGVIVRDMGTQGALLCRRSTSSVCTPSSLSVLLSFTAVLTCCTSNIHIQPTPKSSQVNCKLLRQNLSQNTAIRSHPLPIPASVRACQLVPPAYVSISPAQSQNPFFIYTGHTMMTQTRPIGWKVRSRLQHQ